MAIPNYLVQVLDRSTSTWVTVPLEFISYENYKITPNQMIDLDSYVASTGKLIRNVLSHTRTKIEFTTPLIESDDWKTVWNIIKAGFHPDNPTERKIRVRYYNPLTDTTAIGTFYVPDVEFDVRWFDKATQTIHYNGVRVAMIEY